MSLQFSLKLINEQDMQRQILIAMRKHLKQNFKKEAQHFSNFAGSHILQAILDSPTVLSSNTIGISSTKNPFIQAL